MRGKSSQMWSIWTLAVQDPEIKISSAHLIIYILLWSIEITFFDFESLNNMAEVGKYIYLPMFYSLILSFSTYLSVACTGLNEINARWDHCNIPSKLIADNYIVV